MISIPMLGGISIPAEQQTRLLEGALVLGGAITVAGFILVPKAGLLVLIGCTALWFLGSVGDVFRGRFDGILLWWATAFPFGYYFALPREGSIVTLDRVVILVALMGLFLTKPSTLIPMTNELRWAGLVWLAFIAVAGITLGKSRDVLPSAHMLFDGFLLPLLLGWCVIARFNVRRRIPALHTAVCISSIICAVIATAEMVTGQDLLPNGNSVMFFAGSIPRPNGPFATNDALALVGAVSFFFLLFLRAALGPKLSAGRRMLHSIGLAATLGMALMPLFRSVAITLLIVLFIDTFWEQKTTRRAWRVGLMLVSVGLIFAASVFAPDMFEDRSSTANVYGRVAQFEQSLRLFADHPVLGVGFYNFHSFVGGESRYLAVYAGVSSLDSPHSNLAQVLTETGILGFVPYVLAHVLLFRAMWQLRKLGRCGYSVWKYYIYVFLCYWISGLTESAGYSPLNLWYLFVVTVFCKYVLTEPDLMQSAEVQVPDEAFSVLALSSSLCSPDEPTI
jgi:O-Antigen ligase